jgi:hypothetical protein
MDRESQTASRRRGRPRCGQPGGRLIKSGTRYVWKLTVDGNADAGADGGAGTATFYGQASNAVTVTFDELRIDQP